MCLQTRGRGIPPQKRKVSLAKAKKLSPKRQTRKGISKLQKVAQLITHLGKKERQKPKPYIIKS